MDSLILGLNRKFASVCDHLKLKFQLNLVNNVGLLIFWDKTDFAGT